MEAIDIHIFYELSIGNVGLLNDKFLSQVITQCPGESLISGDYVFFYVSRSSHQL